MATFRNSRIRVLVLAVALVAVAMTCIGAGSAFAGGEPEPGADVTYGLKAGEGDFTSQIPKTGSCGAEGDNVTYVLDDDGVLTISGTGAIAEGAFAGNDAIKQVVVGEGVTAVGVGSFADCAALVIATLPSSLESVGAGAFFGCESLAGIEMPAGVATIGEYAFGNCITLESIVLPDSVTNVNEGVFSYCVALKSIALPSGLTTIEESAFAYCIALKSVTLPSGLTTIEEGAFAYCVALTTADIPAGVTSIGVGAFADCLSLTSVSIPAGLRSIGMSAFGSCTSLERITVAEGNEVYDSRDGCNAIVETATNALVQGCANTVVPNTVTEIAPYAFIVDLETIYDYQESIGETLVYPKLTSITIPQGVTSIGESAFYGCDGLESVALPVGLESIGAYTFSSCSALKTITIPDGVTSIGAYAFQSCTSLEMLAIPASVTSIGSGAFSGTNAAIEFAGSRAQWASITGGGSGAEPTIYGIVTVTFNTNGGSEVASQDLARDEKATVPNPAPTKEWCEFDGWYIDETLETPFDFNVPITEDTTAHAKWIESCVVTFDSCGGTAVEAQHVMPGGKAVVPNPVPTKEWAQFDGWYTDKDYETEFDFANTAIEGDITLYAKWLESCVVTFEANGGTAVEVQHVWPNETATEPNPAPTKEDCRFGGWYADADCTASFDFGAPITQDTTIYAKWITQCAVTFNSCGGSSVEAQLIWPGDLAMEPDPAPTKEGREFAGWYTDKDYGTAFDFANTAIEGDITLYAKWQIDSEDGAAYAKFDSGTGTLTFFRSRDEYATLQKKTYLDGDGNEQTITYYADIETTDWPASTSSAPRWKNEYRTLTRVVFEDKIAPISTAMWFYGLSKLESFEGMENLNTSNVNNMIGMFYGCSKLSELDVSRMDVSNVKRFDSMFTGCQSLTELDVSGFDTSQAESLAQMFGGCNALTALDVSGFDTSNVTNMSHMFRSCMALTELDVSGFDTSKVENMAAMFLYCEKLGSLDVSGFDTSHVTNMQSTFQFCSALTGLSLSGWDTSNVRTMDDMFSGCSSFTSLDLTNFDTSNVESMQRMFHWCYGLTSLDLSKFKTSKVANMSGMFNNCVGLSTLDLSDLDVSQVKDFSEMFGYCHALTSLDLTGWDTSSAETMGGMFEGCDNLVSVDMSNLDTSHVTNFNLLFKKCSSLSNLNLSGLDTSSAKGMRYMFDECSSLTSLDLSGFKTSNVTDMQYMFYGCSSLAALDLSGWDTSNVTTMTNMFYGCESLPNLDVSGFVTSSVTDMSGMFYGCKGLTSLDLSNFNTSNVTNMGTMFDTSGLTTLDLSGFDTSSVTYMRYMFFGCDKLTKLDLSGFDTSKVEDIYGMLSGCSSLEAIKLGAKTQLSNAELPVREWQLMSLSEPSVRYDALGGYDGANPGWYLKGYRDLSIEGLVDAEYTGEPITQTPTVSMGDQVLVADVDYTVSYAANTNAGTATVTIAGMGDWVGSATRTFEISAKPIQPTLTLSQTVFPYNGSRQTPEVVVKNGGVELVANEDYEVAFPDGCKDVGTYPVNVTLKGNYSGNASSTFDIVVNATEPTITLSPSMFTYDGTVKTPEVTVVDADGVPIADEDYTVAFPDDSKDVGEYTVGVKLQGGYSGSGSATFKITAKEIVPTVILTPPTFTYDGTVKTPEVAVWDGEDKLVAGEDYEVALPDDSTEVGTYAATVTLKGNYSGSANAKFEIAAIAIEPTVTLSPATFVYNGEAKTPEVTVWNGEGVLVAGMDYDVVFPDDRKNVGIYKVTVNLKGNYSGRAAATFEVVAKTVQPTVVLSSMEFTYNGDKQTPKVTVKDGDDVLVASRDYDVALPSGCKDVGVYKMEVTLKGNYSGSAIASFKIAQAANTLSAKAKSKKAVVVKASKLQKKAVKIARKKALVVSGAKGSVSYELVGVKKAKFKKFFKVNAKTGLITVKKGLKRGLYKVRVKVTAGDNNYETMSKVVAFKVRVR